MSRARLRWHFEGIEAGLHKEARAPLIARESQRRRPTELRCSLKSTQGPLVAMKAMQRPSERRFAFGRSIEGFHDASRYAYAEILDGGIIRFAGTATGSLILAVATRARRFDFDPLSLLHREPHPPRRWSHAPAPLSTEQPSHRY
jgi:hypothetical protein